MDRELEQLLKEVMTELKDLTRVLSGSSRVLLQNTRHTKQEIETRKRAIKVIEAKRELDKEAGILTEKLNKEYDESIDALNDFQKSAKASTGVMGLLGKGLKFLKDATFGVAIAMAKTALALSDTTQKVEGLESIIALGANELPFLGRALTEVGREIDANVNVFTELSKVGASFGSSIIQLRAAQVEALMPLGKFTDLIGSNSTLLAKLFGSVSEGVPQITRLTRELRDITERDFAKFGLTLDDTSEYMMTYLELERARGNTERMSRTQLLQGTKDYTKNLVILSKLTGKSVDELNDANMAHAADGVMQSQISKMSAKDAKILTSNINSLPGPMRQFAKEMMFLGAPIQQVSKDLEAMSGGKYGEAFKRFKEDLDPIAFQNAIKTIGDEVMDNAGAFGKAGLATGDFVEALNSVAETIGVAVDRTKIEGEMAARGDSIVSLRNLASEVDVTKVGFEEARFKLARSFLYDDDSVVNVTTGFKKQMTKLNDVFLPAFARKLEGFAKWASGVTGKSVEADLKNAAEKGKDKLSGYLEFLGIPIDIGASQGFEAKEGTGGFKNFGSGTPAILHGKEAVVPANTAFGSALSILETLAAKPADTNVNNTKEIVNNNMSSDLTILNNSTKELVELNKKVAHHLNTLVTVGVMTEKNTNKTKISLENMSGTLV
jgi:hypothetical protein